MLGMLRGRISVAGVVAMVAVVLAMSGGAFAATRYLITSTKQISPKVLKQLKGNTGAAGAKGAAGAAGAAGPQGPQGTAGANGANGSSGSNGVSVTSKEIKAGEAGCEKRGGAEFTSASGKTTACNGKEGSPWTAGGTLPAGSTETGTWGARFPRISEGGQKEVATPVSISFTIPLAAALSETQVHYVTLAEQATPSAECPGSAEDPKAAEGELCIYEGAIVEGEGTTELRVSVIAPPTSLGNPEGAGTTGAIAFVDFAGADEEETSKLQGDWAVSAPAP